ncbi:hypothetical protein [Rhodovulum sp. PH10]|uniref:hypothetical protein n=1 Tax=Rhodovulum sp. PH10 TaxID=1187851 RepID=UPI00058F265C|nr:hypothetical protein [Rhodovulum sp. PH10]
MTRPKQPPAPTEPRPTRARPDVARPTEDDHAQAQLGGTRGDRALAPAPMTPQRADKTPKEPSGGHTT